MQQLLTLLVALFALALPTLAGATAYDLPGNMPAGCTRSGSTYTCGAVTLGFGDTLTVSAPKPATVNVSGNFSTDTSQINTAGAASDLTLNITGALTLGYQAKLTANITAGSVNDAGGGKVAITGNLTASGGNIVLAYQTTVSGNVSTSGTGTISTPQSGSIGGSLSAGSGTITMNQSSTVAGSVTTTGGNVSVGQSAVVSGNVSAGSGAVDLGYQASVVGNISSTGTITTGQGSQVGGNISGDAGNVSVGYGASVSGTITTTTGSISFAQNAVASSCAKSTGSASITLGYQSNVNSVCCGTSCSSSCVVNNSGYVTPPLCSSGTPTPTLVADYRMDETAGWNGTAGEVKDSSSNGYHAQAATASAGTPVATTLASSPAYGTTNAGSCKYAVFDRASPSTTHAYVQLPGTFPSLSSSFSVVAWVRSTAPTQGGQRIIARDDNQDGWALSLGDAGTASLRIFNRNISASGAVTTGGSSGSGATTGNCSAGTFCLDSAPVFAANTWYYVALLVDTANKTVQTLVYNTAGTLLASASSAYTGNWAAGTGGTTLGGESASSGEGVQSGFHFNGNIDELQVYTGLLSTSAITSQLTRSRACPLVSFAVSGTGTASTCTPQTLTITAQDAAGNALTSYTGTINLSTSTGKGDWSAGSGPAPSGTLTPGAANSGQASYSFAAGDAGAVRLRLSHSLGQTVTVSVADSSGTPSGTSAALNFRDNAFVWTEDAGNLIAGSFVAVAGRNHDLRVSLYKKDTATGNCSVATDYTGSRNLKLWRTDNGGPWTAPSVVSPALVVPASRPASNNLTLAFTAGVANFNLATTNIGKYALSLDDDSLTYAATTVSGTSADLTVRPFTLAINGLTSGGTANPGGSQPADAVFTKAGAAFSATVSAYRWSSGADANNDGVPDAGATLAQVSAGGLAAGFNSGVTLTNAPNSVTPGGGTPGTLSNNVVSGFSGGSATVSNLSYSEVGSFALNTNGVVTNYLGTAGLSLDALVFNAAGTQQTRVGRFIPAGFALSSPSVSHRVALNCATPSASASTFTYLDEDFRLGFTLTARNAAGGTTVNYTGSFARLNLSTATNFNLAGIAGSTMFKTGNNRLDVSSSTGSWSLGVANGITLTARGLRAATPDGPFDTDFGIAPVDPDGVGMLSLDLDTDSPANGADSTKVSTIPLRYGRLRLQNGTAPANRALSLPLAAQYWTGTAFTTNNLDSCTRISATQLSFGNLPNKTLVVSDASMSGSSVTLSGGVGSLTLAAPASGHVGTLDVAIALDSATPPADQSCLKNAWTPAKTATTGAGLKALRGFWCGNASTNDFRDPSARATWGLYRGADGVLYQRENY